MRVIEITTFGDPDVLQPAERERPAPGPGEVLIEVAAAGVNHPDLVQRQGRYPPPAGATDLPGLEVAGTIVELGEPDEGGPQRWAAGDRVVALVTGGGYAEYVTAPAGQCLPIPGGLGFVEAAAIPETFFTVWSNVFGRGRLAEGEYFLVHGGASGIGTTAIQLARAFGAHVLATAGTDEKCAACERLGAERAINYRTDDFVLVAREHSAGVGMDVILSMVAGDYVPRNVDLLAMDGRLVQIATMGGTTAEVNIGTLMRRRLTITGSTLRPQPTAAKAATARALEMQVWPLLASGAVRPVVHATFPLSQAADAHRLLEEGNHVGKVILTVTT